VKEESSSFLKKGGARPAGTKKLLCFEPCSVSCGTDRRQSRGIKSFLLLFFKKEVLSFARPALTRLP
jgi:hypothetical protein